MRRTRRLSMLGSALCTATILIASPVGAATTATAAPTLPAVASAAAAGGVESAGALRSAMRATVDAGATGMIARVDDGDHVTRIGVGVARLQPRRPVHASDAVRVGSITKSMVATVTLQLVGERGLHLGDTVEHWLPGLVPGGERITIRMLLKHTSGIYDYTEDPTFVPRVLADPYRYWSPQELVALATTHPPVFAPGTSWSYSNTNYILIGLVLEKVTGSSIQTLLNRRVIKPLHLRHTFFATSGRFRGAHAHGYLPPSLTGDGYVDVSGWSPSWGWAAGAVVSNAPDLARFYKALMSGRLLEPWLLRQMTTTVKTGQQGVRYGLGIFSLATTCGQVWGHNGDIFGYNSFALTDRRGSRSAIVLLPTQPDDAIAAAATQVLAIAVCMMLGHPVSTTAPQRSAATLDLPATGSYFRRR
jgi:D-alanyl-D-alanine carboxypeptidase